MPTVSLASSLNPALPGQAVTITVTVSGQSFATNLPTGTVAFTVDGTDQPNIPLVKGTASLPLSGLVVGPHTVAVSYGGDSTFAASTAILSQTVSPPPADPALPPPPAAPSPPLPLADVTGLVMVTSGKRRRSTPLRQTVTVRNRGSAAVPGPLYLVASRLTRRVRLRNATGLTQSHATPGDPYVLLAPAGLAPGQVLTFDLLFVNPRHRPVKFQPLIFAGSGVL